MKEDEFFEMNLECNDDEFGCCFYGSALQTIIEREEEIEIEVMEEPPIANEVQPE